MEKRLNKKIENYITKFKDDIKGMVTEMGCSQDEKINELLLYIYGYEHPILNKEDFQKRKRVKNFVPIFDRCCAKRATNEQCTRRKKDSSEYCGTHMKGTPHGIIDNKEENKVTTQKIEVWAQDIQGIVYYIDKFNNVYQAEDIIVNRINPKIIAKYVKNGEEFNIPEFGI